MAQPQALQYGGENAPLAIEAPVNVDLEAILADYNSPHTPQYTPDTLNERFIIHVNEALPDLSSPFAEAYRASDQVNSAREIYALVLSPNHPARTDVLEALNGYTHPNLLTQYGTGQVYLSHKQAVHTVAIYDRPAGKRLSDILEQKRIPSHTIYETYMTQLNSALQVFREKELVHGGIHPSNIFVGERVVLGESISEPCGYSQEFYYEPLERAICSQDGKGNGTPYTDSYALAVLAMDMMGALQNIRELEESTYLNGIVKDGSYALLTGKREIPEVFEDLLRGSLTEKTEERWTLEQVHQWVKGRRSNLIPPNSHRDSTRPFQYKGEDLFSLRAIAHSMSREWRNAIKELHDSRIARWLEVSINNADIADVLDRLLSNTKSNAADAIKADAVARLQLLFDPPAPLRFYQLKAHFSSFGFALIEAFKHDRGADIQSLKAAISSDIHTYWADLYPDMRPDDNYKLLWQIQKAKESVNNNSMGFGVERMIYELNEGLPCQYETLLPYQVTTLEQLITTMDALAKEHKDDSLANRHLAGFLAAHLNINREIGFKELALMPKLQRHPELVVMRLLGQVQTNHQNPKLVGLSTWCALRLSELINEFQNRKTRTQMRKDLTIAAKTGYVNNVISILVNKNNANGDIGGYQKAIQLYQYNNVRINSLKQPNKREAMARDLGGRLSSFISYCILFVTIFFLLNKYQHGLF